MPSSLSPGGGVRKPLLSQPSLAGAKHSSTRPHSAGVGVTGRISPSGLEMPVRHHLKPLDAVVTTVGRPPAGPSAAGPTRPKWPPHIPRLPLGDASAAGASAAGTTLAQHGPSAERASLSSGDYKGFVRAQYRKLQKEVEDGVAHGGTPDSQHDRGVVIQHIRRCDCPEHSKAAIRKWTEDQEQQRLQALQQQWHDLAVIENGGRERIDPVMKSSTALATSLTKVRREGGGLVSCQASVRRCPPPSSDATAAVTTAAPPPSHEQRKGAVVIALQEESDTDSNDSVESGDPPLFTLAGPPVPGSRRESISGGSAGCWVTPRRDSTLTTMPLTCRSARSDSAEEECCVCCPCRRPEMLMAQMGITPTLKDDRMAAAAMGMLNLSPDRDDDDFIHRPIRRRARRTMDVSGAMQEMSDVIVEELEMLTAYPPQPGIGVAQPYRNAHDTTTGESIGVPRTMSLLGACAASAMLADDDDEILVSVNDFRRRNSASVSESSVKPTVRRLDSSEVPTPTVVG